MDRVLVLLADPENRDFIGDSLAPQYDVSFDVPQIERDNVELDSIDLLVVDNLSLKLHAEKLLAERLAHEPVLLPVLLISDRRTIASMTSEMWCAVDDVVLRPLETLELQARVESLARARSFSLQTRDVSHVLRQENEAAERFQKAALPRKLPEVPGLTFSSLYRSGIDEAKIGGDWYDALLLSDGRVMLSIGDVCGSGLEAAVAMAHVRQVVRGVAQINPDPMMLLDAADRTLKAEDRENLVTAFVAIFDPVTSLLTYAGAGHPRPLLRGPDGVTVELASSGAPLGIPFQVERDVRTVVMPVGSLLVMYTDGLTEATHDPIAGENALRAAIDELAVREAPNCALALHDALIDEGAHDDIAVLTVAHGDRDLGRHRLLHWSFDTSDPEATREARREFLLELERCGISGEALHSAELVFRELVGNVVRYAPKWADVTLDLSGATAPVLHVLDKGHGFRNNPKLPDNVMSEHGRGLYIIARLTEEFHVSERPHGGSHARAILART